MGESPAKEYYADQAAQLHKEKRQAQRKRVDMLTAIIHSVGFGEYDSRLTEVEKEAARHLQLAYELLGMLSRSQ